MLTVAQTGIPGLFEALADRGFSIDLARNIRELGDQGLTTLRFGDVIVDLLRPVIPSYAHVLDRAVTKEILGQDADDPRREKFDNWVRESAGGS